MSKVKKGDIVVWDHDNKNYKVMAVQKKHKPISLSYGLSVKMLSLETGKVVDTYEKFVELTPASKVLYDSE